MEQGKLVGYMAESYFDRVREKFNKVHRSLPEPWRSKVKFEDFVGSISLDTKNGGYYYLEHSDLERLQTFMGYYGATLFKAWVVRHYKDLDNGN